ncbi:ABC transporter substrate-binding protein [Streptomyces zagrosensis]|uniref:Peptide/nickel transport system substrate-binding protein n=1 Tax=Streptomyces zagrosensis TaxID=1042984 RepID=A0A7W9V214_9ACTN|nr:ABC transporter substrate-binding protein [Streptomyces zagrosensis]MBB5938836.1 peptide/nickel transport system substrate-binding protein [Streptomyces zagrosensis]
MRKRDQWLATPLGVGLVAAVLAGCGSGDGASAGTGKRIVMGMSDQVLSTDPAAGYDPGSWLLFNNVFQSLLSFPKGSSTPQPEAAKTCGFKDSESKVFACTLQSGLKFTNGHDLTSEDVKFSFERTLAIDDADGPAVMLSSIDKIDTPDERTVTFRLKTSDATFPQKIASGAGSIVDHREYPKDKLRTDNKAVGSGVYSLDSFDKKEAKFAVNGTYKGPADAQNSGLTMKFFHGDQPALAAAVRKGDIDLAYRGLESPAVAAISAQTGDDAALQVVEGTGSEVQHLVFNMHDPVVRKLGVRKAMAYLIDRSALARDVYQRTVQPLYSIVPAGITTHKTPYYDMYGDDPQQAKTKAKAALRADGITDKVKLTLWATPIRYGPGTGPALRLIAKQLNESGLFEANVQSAEFDAYEKGINNGDYSVYVKGWVPDYPDPDNFIAPFFGPDNVLANHYDAGDITSKLLPRTAGKVNRAATVDDFERIQQKVAKDLPVIPLWQGKQYAVARDSVSGLQWSLDASTVFRFWEIGKSDD